MLVLYVNVVLLHIYKLLLFCRPENQAMLVLNATSLSSRYVTCSTYMNHEGYEMLGV